MNINLSKAELRIIHDLLIGQKLTWVGLSSSSERLLNKIKKAQGEGSRQ